MATEPRVAGGSPPASADGERARLFFALELPGPVRSAVSDWGDTHLGELGALRRVRPESWHVTLCFLGSQPAAAVKEIAAGGRVVASLPRISLSLGEPLWLPRRRPRVLALEVADAGLGALASLQSALGAAMAAAGFYEPEARPFRGHVTVARVASGQGRRPVKLPPPAPLRFDATDVTLYRSRLGSGPARYEALETVTLTAA